MTHDGVGAVQCSGFGSSQVGPLNQVEPEQLGHNTCKLTTGILSQEANIPRSYDELVKLLCLSDTHLQANGVGPFSRVLLCSLHVEETIALPSRFHSTSGLKQTAVS